MDKSEREPDDEIIASYGEAMKGFKGISGTVSFGGETVHTDDIVGDMLSDTRVREMLLELHQNGEVALREFRREMDGQGS